MMLIEDKQQSIAIKTLENAGFTSEQAKAIATAIRLISGESPPKFPARILQFK